MDLKKYISPAVRGGIVALAGGTVGGFALQIPVVGGFLAPYVGIAGGALTLIIVEMFYR